jgi:DHA1 family bicyclomycin/chloramphenicol resistance-like MFS transporter
MSPRTKIILVLGVLSAIGPLSIDMYLPAFKNIAKALQCSPEQMGYTLSSFFFGICLGQLVNGPLLDHFGRKKVLYIGLGIYVISSFACAMSASVEPLISWRFFQAIGCSVGWIAPNAVIRETFEESERPKILSLMILILGVSPILAPSIGSMLLTFGSWKFIFILLAIIILLILILIKQWLPEKVQEEARGPFHVKKIVHAYVALFANRRFVLFAFAGAIGAGSIFTFVSGAPPTFLSYYGASESQFGWIFGLVASGIISASQVNNLVIKKFTSMQILRVALLAQFLICLFLSVGAKFGWLQLETNILLLFLILACQGFIFPNLTSLALQPFHQGAGAASAMMGAIQMAWGAICAALLGILFDGTPFTMAIIMLLCASVANILFSLIKKHPSLATSAA